MYVVLFKRFASGYWLVSRDHIFDDQVKAEEYADARYEYYYNHVVYTVNEAIKYFQDCQVDFGKEIQLLKLYKEEKNEV